jgi:hypothetical protein
LLVKTGEPLEVFDNYFMQEVGTMTVRKWSALLAAMTIATTGLTGCGGSTTGKKTTTGEDTRTISEDGWGSITSGTKEDSGNFTKLKCGMAASKIADLGYLSEEKYDDFSGNEKAQTMDLCMQFYTDSVTSFDYTGELAELGVTPYDEESYDGYMVLYINGDTGELYSAQYSIGIADAEMGAEFAKSIFEQYDNGSGQEVSENRYLITDVEAFNGDVAIYGGTNNDGTKNQVSFMIYNEDYNNATNFFENGIRISTETTDTTDNTTE